MAISGPGFEYPNLKTQALLRRKRQEREEEIRREQRKADAALVRAAGCSCRNTIDQWATGEARRQALVALESGDHGYDPRCPVALADALEGK